MYPRC
ncbi:hypothetical protein HaLaN_12902, partial [Haematococcus lacustris]